MKSDHYSYSPEKSIIQPYITPGMKVLPPYFRRSSCRAIGYNSYKNARALLMTTWTDDATGET
jgi:hypothetical protein